MILTVGSDRWNTVYISRAGLTPLSHPKGERPKPYFISHSPTPVSSLARRQPWRTATPRGEGDGGSPSSPPLRLALRRLLSRSYEDPGRIPTSTSSRHPAAPRSSCFFVFSSSLTCVFCSTDPLIRCCSEESELLLRRRRLGGKKP